MGKHKVGAILFCEREKSVTGAYAVNASRFCVPPTLILTQEMTLI
jgi:hypothetical protein